MKTKLFSALILVILLIVPNIIFGQAPSLGTASSFALFTSTGAFNNTGTSLIKGNIGSFDYNPMGFPPGVIIGGAKYGPSDGLSTTAASDVVAAYNELSAVSCVVNLTLPLAGQVLIPGVYCYGAAATLNGEITLNGQGNPDALFIIKIGGAFATVGGSSIKLINSASPNNVYWQINGDFNLVDGSAFQGNVLVNGAINLLGTATLIGRGLSKAGAISTTSNTVTLGTPPAAPTVTITQPFCTVATGIITITAPTGASMTYSIDGYNYTNTDGIFTGLVAGNYNITAKDLDGYVSSITSVTIDAQPLTPTAPVVGLITQPTCILSSGSVSLSGLPTGNWTVNPGAIAGNTASTTITGLTEGTYNFTVTNDEGCTSLASSDVVIDAQPITPIAPVVGLITQPTCILSTGSVSLSGLPTGTWIINPGAINGNTASINITGLAEGTYNFTVTNDEGCTSLASSDVVIDAQPITPTAPAVGLITQPTCILATGSVFLSGLPLGNWTINPGAIAGNIESTTISGLAEGTYNFTVTNDKGCTSLASGDMVIDAQPLTPTAPVVGLITQPTCILSTGSVFLSGLPLGNWTVNPGAIAGNTASTTITGLAEGTYNFTVTNDEGCTSLASSDVVVDAQPITPTAPVIGLTTQPTCILSTGSVSLSGLPAGNWTVNPGAIAGNTASTTITGLAEGTYNFTVTNDEGCTSLASSDVVIDAQPITPTAPAVGLITQPTCVLATGSVSLSGLPTGTWIINPGAINGNTASINITGLAEGTYNFTVTNDEGCTSLASSDVVIDAQPITPTAPAVGLITQPTCILATGSVFLSGLPLGNWTINPGAIAGNAASTTITGLAEGTYNFTVTNDEGCTSLVSSNVVVDAQPITPTAPAVGLITQPTCTLSTGSVFLSGLPTGTWIINPGAINGSTASKTISGLAEGTYNFTVTNDEGCTSLASSNVVVDAQPITPTAPVAIFTSPICTEPTGTITITSPIGAGITYSIDGLDYTNTTGVFYLVIPGTYTVTAKGNGGCISPPLTLIAVITDCSADLSINKTVNNAYPIHGGTIVFTIVANNVGSNDASGVIVNEILESGFTYISSSTIAGSYSNSSGVWTIGALNKDASASLTIVTTVNSTGNYINTATIVCNETDSYLDNNTSTVTVYPANLFIPEGFSPNNDGINDLFVIRAIENYPDNRIVIFNRWGNKVYESSPYYSEWNGKSTGGFSIGVGDLPSGTYFYLLDLGNGSKVIKGTVYLNR